MVRIMGFSHFDRNGLIGHWEKLKVKEQARNLSLLAEKSPNLRDCDILRFVWKKSKKIAIFLYETILQWLVFSCFAEIIDLWSLEVL